MCALQGKLFFVGEVLPRFLWGACGREVRSLPGFLSSVAFAEVFCPPLCMSLFLSTYRNKIDKKGRVSVPSSFRATLKSESFEGVVLYRSVVNSCIEGCAFSRIEQMSEAIEALDTLSEEKDAFATSILGACHQVAFDTEGRIFIPKDLLSASSVAETAVFVGKGRIFEIWGEGDFDKHLAMAQQIAAEKKGMLRLNAVPLVPVVPS